VAQKYPHLECEKKWQAFWEANKSFKAPVMPGPKKKYILDMFPYPSGSGLHVGHPCGYTATDIMSRYWRMQGYDVLHPMGWDAFGLPAEQHAMNTGTHPAVTTKTNINTFRSQLKALGFSYDWDREIATTHNTYVRWTQWIFLQLFKNGLAFQGNQNVNWCPALGTVLANEEVIDGLSERGNHPVVKHPIRQWVLKITAYGDQLHDHLEGLNWPEGTMAAQKAWIGRQEGANVRFRVPVGGAGTGAPDLHLDTFTSRVETLMGVTFIAVAPEHPLVNALLGAVRASLPDGDAAHEEHCAAVRAYVESVASKTDLERAIDVGKDRAKTGILLHPQLFAEHPLTGAKVPIFLADYVLSGYGSGAVMGVPGHDERDRSFAAMFDLPAVTITEDEKVLCNSGEFDGLSVENGKYWSLFCALMFMSLVGSD
jgi:leucyl-tRNA synthetase